MQAYDRCRVGMSGSLDRELARPVMLGDARLFGRVKGAEALGDGALAVDQLHHAGGDAGEHEALRLLGGPTQLAKSVRLVAVERLESHRLLGLVLDDAPVAP